jgi:putative addiction module component (TIGR02574 family)
MKVKQWRLRRSRRIPGAVYGIIASMTRAAEKILAEAMAWGPDERLALAETLLESAATSSDPAYMAAWESEIDRRIAEYERGEAGAAAWEEVRKRLTDDAGNG